MQEEYKSEEELRQIFGTSRSFTDWLHDPTNPLVYCLLTLDGKDFLFKDSYTVEVHQKTADHDTFCITVPDDALDSFEGYVMENSRGLLGKEVSIAYWRFGAVRQTFSGIIGGIRNKKNEGGGYGDLYISGYAPSILLESGKDCRSFEDKTLEDIIKEVNEVYPDNAKVKVDLPNTKYTLPYTVQYKESDYAFIQRLSKRYGEFFYYNGERLILGNGTQPIIKLGENIDLIDIEFDMTMGAQDFEMMSYDSLTGAKVNKTTVGLQSEFKENLFQSIAVNASKDIFRKRPKMHFNAPGIGDHTEKELQEAVKLEKERREGLMRVKGRSRDPELKIGGRAELSDINAKAMETYRIIEISHYHDGNEYYNEFIGIPDLFYASMYIDTEAYPKGEEQPARVVDNNDPRGMGRVRVQFPWQEEKNRMTPWIRQVQPHSGAGKGFYFIPEIGEEVLVGFESDNAEKPYVSGALYNGSEVSGYHTEGNDQKVIQTRSGTKIILNDAEGSVFIEDPSGNTYLMDGQGNINVNAPNNFTVNAGQDISFTAGGNMNVVVGMNKMETISLTDTQSVGGIKNISVAGNFMTNVTGSIMENVNGNIESHTDAQRKVQAKNVGINSEIDIQTNAQKNVQRLSGEMSNDA